MTLSRRHWFHVSGAATVGTALPVPSAAEAVDQPAPIAALEPEPELPGISSKSAAPAWRAPSG